MGGTASQTRTDATLDASYPTSTPASTTSTLGPAMSIAPDASAAPELFGSGSEPPYCAIPEHDARATLPAPPPVSTPQSASPPAMSVAPSAAPDGGATGQSAPSQTAAGQQSGADAASGSGGAQTQTPTDGTGAAPAQDGDGAPRGSRTRQGRRARRRSSQGGEGEDTAAAEPAIEVPDLRLAPLRLIAMPTMAALNLPGALRAADPPSATMTPPETDEADQRREIAAATAFADQRYNEAAARAIKAATSQVNAARSAARRIESEAERVLRDVEAGAGALDRELESRALAADLRLLAEAEERKTFVESRFKAAMGRLYRANRIAHGAATQGDEKAGEHLKKVCETYAVAFTDEIRYAIGDIEAAGKSALESIETFRSNATAGQLLSGQSRGTDALNEIQKEANKQKGNALADFMKKGMEKQLHGGGDDTGANQSSADEVVMTSADGPAATVNQSVPQTPASGGMSRVRGRKAAAPNSSGGGIIGQLGQKYATDKPAFEKRLKPSLEESLKTTRDTVNDTLVKTFRRTAKMLRDQRDRANEMIDRQTAQIRVSLANQRQLARDTIKTQADQASETVEGRAVSARGGLERSARSLRPHQQSALERLTGTLAATASAPPTQIRKTADIAARKVGESLSGAARVQTVQGEVITNTTVEGLTGDGTKFRAVNDAFRTTQLETIAGTETAAEEAVRVTAEETVKTFPDAVKAMQEAGQSAALQFQGNMKSASATADADQAAQIVDYAAGMDGTVGNFTKFADPYKTPETVPATAKVLLDTYSGERAKVDTALTTVTGKLNEIDNTVMFSGTEQQGLVAALRGFTLGKGWHFEDRYGFGLYTRLRGVLNDNNYNAAYNYLLGRNAAGAAYELEESRGIVNDDEARMEATLRALNPDELAELDRAPANSEMGRMRDRARAVLGGTDAQVFDALRQGNYARADAYRFLEAQRRNLRSRNADDAQTTVRQYTGAAQAGQWGQNPTANSEARRQAIANELANIRNPRGTPSTTNLSSDQEQQNLQAMADFATGTYTTTNPYRPQDGSRTHTTWRGANHDLVRDLVLHGANSREARAAQIGVEIERGRNVHSRGYRPDVNNLDTALYDPRLNPNTYPPDFVVPDAIRERATRERDEMLMLAYGRYGERNMSATTDDPQVARDALIQRLTERQSHDRTATQLITGMVNEPVPSPNTAALAMDYASRGAGTREPIIWRFAGRMSREELDQMDAKFRDHTRRTYGREEGVHERLGLYGHGRGDLSGSARLRGERVFRGMARTDREKAEAAVYAVLQQQREVGGVGAARAENTETNRLMGDNLSRLQAISGGNLTFTSDGRAIWTGSQNFDAQGTFTGTENQQAAFASAVAGAQGSASAYQSLIDHYASQAALGVMILGIIAAAAVTIATGGAAGPLLMAAIAGAAGLGGMAVKASIRGGGYGWEEAAVDLGMTAVDMLTAGVGQALGLASRGGVEAARQGMRAGLSIRAARHLGQSLTQPLAETAGRTAILGGRTLGQQAGRGALLTGSRFGDQLAIGAISGGLGGLGKSALDERTYDERGRGVLWNLALGTVTGAASGAATSAVSFGVERGLGRTSAGAGRTLEELTGDATARGIMNRAVLEGLSGGAGAFAGTGVQLGIDAMRGRFKGDFGDALLKMGEEGLKNFAQGVFEGGGQGIRERRQRIAAGKPLSPADAQRAQADVDAAQQALEGGEMDAGATQPMRPSDADTPPPRSAAPEGDTHGTAAAVGDGMMRGDLLKNPHETRTTMRHADRFGRDPPPTVGRIRAETSGNGERRFTILGPDGEPMTGVRVTQVPRTKAVDGEYPAAQFRRVRRRDGSFEYVVEVSGRTHPDMVQRALAHEFTEIRAIERRRAAGEPDADLTPDRARDRLQPDADPPEGTTAKDLTPHDQARIAEFQVIQRELAADGLSAERRLMLTDEAQRLAHHLGLTGDTPGARARLDLAADAAGGDLADFVRSMAAGAEGNPFLRPVAGTLDQQLSILAARLSRARHLDRALGVADPLQPHDIFKMSRDEVGTYQRRRQRAADEFGSELPTDRVLAEAGRLLVGIGAIVPSTTAKGATGFQAGSGDPALMHRILSGPPELRALVNTLQARFGDSDFLDLVRNARFRELYAVDPAQQDALRLEADRKLAPSAIDDARLSDLVARDAATVGKVLDARDALLDQRRQLAAEHKTAKDARRQEIKSEINQVDERLRKVAELLGEDAGRRMVEARNANPDDPVSLSEIKLAGGGRDYPDLVYRNEPGKRPILVIVEAKGGDSTLGTRRSVDGVRDATQGTTEYLMSLARDMTGPTKPRDVRRLGQEILRLLATDPSAVEYQLVQQRLPDRGRVLPPPEVGTFQMRDPDPDRLELAMRPRRSRSGAADPVEGSQHFHGEAQPRPALPSVRESAALDATLAIAERTRGVGGAVSSFVARGRGTMPGGEIEVARLSIDIAGRDGTTPVSVRTRPAHQMGVGPDGRRRPAEFVETDDGFVVYLSTRTRPQDYERALNHEFGEIARIENATAAGDRLARNATEPAVDDMIPQLSPHDEGRIGELEVLGRQLAADPQNAQTREELGHLVRSLGLDQATPAAATRREAVFERLGEYGVDVTQMRPDPAMLADHDAALDHLSYFAGSLDQLVPNAGGLINAARTRIAALTQGVDAQGPDILRYADAGRVPGEVNALLRQIVPDAASVPLGQLVDGYQGNVAGGTWLRDRLLAAHGIAPPSSSRDSTDLFLWRLYNDPTVTPGAQLDLYGRYAWSQHRADFSSPQTRQDFDADIRGLIPEGDAHFAYALNAQNQPDVDEHGRLTSAWVHVGPTADQPYQYAAQLARNQTVGDATTVLVHTDFIGDTGFHHFTRTGDTPDVERRIYLRVAPDTGGALIRDLVNDVVRDPDRFPGVTGLKIASSSPRSRSDPVPKLGGRNESVVIYLANDPQTFDQLRLFLHEANVAHGALLAEPHYQLPFGAVFQTHDGVRLGSVATAPPGSFGTNRTNAVGDAVANSTWSSFQEFRQRVDEAFRRHGIDPDNPHLDLP